MDMVEKEKTRETLHIPLLRRKWQILTFQILSTISLLIVMIRMNILYGSCTEEFILLAEGSAYWCPAYEHTRGLVWLSNTHDPLIPNFLLGIGQSGLSSFSGPLLLCILCTVSWSYILTKGEKLQNDIKKGAGIILALWVFIPFLFTWISSMAFNGPEWPLKHFGALFSPMGFFLELVFLGVVFAPILAGLMGIWGLSRRLITWAMGYFLLVIGIHAILTFEEISGAFDLGLLALPSQIGKSSMFGGLISPLGFDLLLISILLLIFLESGLAAITHLEYAMSLPEGSKNDIEYIKQFNNVVNSNLIHLVVIISLTSFTTMLALQFDDLLVSFVGIMQGSQWSGQVQESLELQMTYGKVISASLFMLVVAGMRYIIPWQRIFGYIEMNINNLRS
ncbi:MAG: hypothetical protein CMB47_01630 [Euryarchaeota archaeon]|nr:hypothetical protein [Euryarchaeota archaeon]|tara:strand:+ start:141 stop:1319 length:1179 start_codon:yes stop_codon:yes gene_type:complete